MKLKALGGKEKFNPKKLGRVLPIALVGMATVSMGVFFMSGRDTTIDSEASSPPPVCGYMSGECQKVGEPISEGRVYMGGLPILTKVQGGIEVIFVDGVTEHVLEGMWRLLLNVITGIRVEMDKCV